MPGAVNCPEQFCVVVVVVFFFFFGHRFYNNVQGRFCYRTYFVAQEVAGEGVGSGAEEVDGVWREGHEGLQGTSVTSRAPAQASALKSLRPQSANLHMLLLLLLLISSLFRLLPRKAGLGTRLL